MKGLQDSSESLIHNISISISMLLHRDININLSNILYVVLVGKIITQKSFFYDLSNEKSLFAFLATFLWIF